MPVPGARHVPDLLRAVGELRHVRIDHRVVGHGGLKCLGHLDDPGPLRHDFRPPRGALPGHRCNIPARAPVFRARGNRHGHRAQQRARVALHRHVARFQPRQHLRIDIHADHAPAVARFVAPEVDLRKFRPQRHDQIGLGEDLCAGGSRKEGTEMQRRPLRHDAPPRVGCEAGRAGHAQHIRRELCTATRTAAKHEERSFRGKDNVDHLGHPVVRDLRKLRFLRGHGRRPHGLSQKRDRHMQRLGPGTRSRELAKRAVDQGIGRFGSARLLRPVADRGPRPRLVQHLVQLATPRRHLVEAGGHGQNRHAVAVGLPQRRHRVHESRPGDQVADTRPTGRPGVSVRHEPRPLFVAREDVTQARLLDPAVKLHVVHAGDAEDDFDATRLQRMADFCPKGSHINLSRI